MSRVDRQHCYRHRKSYARFYPDFGGRPHGECPDCVGDRNKEAGLKVLEALSLDNIQPLDLDENGNVIS